MVEYWYWYNSIRWNHWQCIQCSLNSLLTSYTKSVYKILYGCRGRWYSRIVYANRDLLYTNDTFHNSQIGNLWGLRGLCLLTTGENNRGENCVRCIHQISMSFTRKNNCRIQHMGLVEYNEGQFRSPPGSDSITSPESFVLRSWSHTTLRQGAWMGNYEGTRAPSHCAGHKGAGSTLQRELW